MSTYQAAGGGGFADKANGEKLGKVSGFETVASLNNSREGFGSFSDGTYGYAVGGTGSSTYMDNVEQYDPSADSWTAVASLGTGRRHLDCFFDGTYGYAVGGYNGSTLAKVERYDPTNDSWTTVASLNTARNSHSCFFDGTYGYVAGGTDGSNTISSVERYDPSSDSWTTVSSLNSTRDRHASFFDGTYGYVVGGRDDSNTDVFEAEQYDPSTDSWTAVASLNDKSFTLSAFFDGTYGYAVAGNRGENRIERYDPDADTWTKQPFNLARDNHASFFVSGSGYVVGGYDSDNNTTTDKVVKSIPATVSAFTGDSDALYSLIASNGKLKNTTTGVTVGPEEVLTVRDTENIEYWSTDSDARVIQIGGN